jgi:hypothetical protein
MFSFALNICSASASADDAKLAIAAAAVCLELLLLPEDEPDEKLGKLDE